MKTNILLSFVLCLLPLMSINGQTPNETAPKSMQEQINEAINDTVKYYNELKTIKEDWVKTENALDESEKIKQEAENKIKEYKEKQKATKQAKNDAEKKLKNSKDKLNKLLKSQAENASEASKQKGGDKTDTEVDTEKTKKDLEAKRQEAENKAKAEQLKQEIAQKQEELEKKKRDLNTLIQINEELRGMKESGK